MDTSIFDDRYKNDETGREAYDPKILLKVVLLGYSRGLLSSRQIERACKENVTFMAIREVNMGESWFLESRVFLPQPKVPTSG